MKNDVVILIRERKKFSFKSSCFSFYYDALFYVFISLFTSNAHQNIIPTPYFIIIFLLFFNFFNFKSKKSADAIYTVSFYHLKIREDDNKKTYMEATKWFYKRLFP